MESFFGPLKSELSAGSMFPSREQARAELSEHLVLYYEGVRLHWLLRYAPLSSLNWP